MTDCIRYCGICGKEILYKECINISVPSEDINVDVHRGCFVTIGDWTKVYDIIMR